MTVSFYMPNEWLVVSSVPPQCQCPIQQQKCQRHWQWNAVRVFGCVVYSIAYAPLCCYKLLQISGHSRCQAMQCNVKTYTMRVFQYFSRSRWTLCGFVNTSMFGVLCLFVCIFVVCRMFFAWFAVHNADVKRKKTHFMVTSWMIYVCIVYRPAN